MNNTRKYKITIEAWADVTGVAKGEWGKVGEAPLYETATEPKYIGPKKDVMGVLPDREIVRTDKVTLLEQTVPSLDMIAVIKAINGIA